jgi:hypothetical protein
MSALVLLLAAQFASDVFDNADQFTKLEDRDGITVSRRAVKTSDYWEYRAEVSTPHPVPALCEAIFDWGTRHPDGAMITLNKVLDDQEDVRVVYNQVSAPVVARRDYAMTVVRERLADGSCRIRFRATNEAAPPRPDGFVRMNKMWGEWRLEATGPGASKITYTLFSDPAGSVPAFLVHGSQRQATRDGVVRALEKTKQFLETKPLGTK